MKRFVKGIILTAILIGVAAVLLFAWESRQQLAYRDCINETAFTVGEDAVEMKWLAYYIALEEREIEEQAMLYNAKSTVDYWNLHVDGQFIRVGAKETIMNMAIHDYLYYCEAEEAGITLTIEEQRSLENSVTDFWMDLLDGQEEKLPVSDEYIVESMRRAALAQKYQKQLADEEDHTYASYSYNGSYYKKWRDTQDVTINNRIWNRISVGDITLSHDSVNYVNGYNEEDSE